MEGGVGGIDATAWAGQAPRLIGRHNAGLKTKTFAGGASKGANAGKSLPPLPPGALLVGGVWPEERAAAAAAAKIRGEGEEEGKRNSGSSSPEEKDAASALASLFSSRSSESPTGAKREHEAMPHEEEEGEVDEDEEMEDETENDGGDKKPSAANEKPSASASGGAAAPKRPHAMVDHTYTDYSIIDEDMLAEIDRREKVLSDAGDVLKFIEEAERSVFKRDGPPGFPAGVGTRPPRRALTEAQERERTEKMDKLQKMLDGKLGGPRRNSGGVAQPFPLKLMEVLDRDEYNHIITWMPHGRAFIVRSPKDFTTEILPRFFKQTKYMSFTRQLNLWGFKRITRRGNPDAGAYYHELFLRGRPRLSTRMRREKIKGTGIKLSPNPDAEPDFYKMAKEKPLLTPAEEAEQAAVAALAAIPAAAPPAVPSLPSFPGVGAASAGGVSSPLTPSLRNATELLRQRNDLRQLSLLNQMKNLQDAREEQRKMSAERVAVECAAAFAAKQQQRAAAAAALAARAASHPQDATAILGQILALGGGGQVPEQAAAPGSVAGRDFSRLNAAMCLGSGAAAAANKPQQQPDAQDLLRTLQRQNAAQRQQQLLLGLPDMPSAGSGNTDPLLLGGMRAAPPPKSDALSALAARLSGGGGGGGGVGALLTSPDSVPSASPRATLGSPTPRAAGASSTPSTGSTTAESALLRTLLLEQQQGATGGDQPLPSSGASSGGGGGGGGGGVPSELLAAVAARQRAREVANAGDTALSGGGRGDTNAAPSALSALLGSGSLEDRLKAMADMGWRGA